MTETKTDEREVVSLEGARLFLFGLSPWPLTGKATDDRRNKDYRYRLELYTVLFVDQSAPFKANDTHIIARLSRRVGEGSTGPHAALLRAAKASGVASWYGGSRYGPLPEEIRASVGEGSVLGVALTLAVTVEVDRPKELPAGVVGGLHLVEDRYGNGVRQALLDTLIQAWNEEWADRHAATLAEEAKRLALAIGREADKKARDICRFEQRFAALVAELESERAKQLAREEGELKADPVYEDEQGGRTPIDPRVLKAALAVTPQALPALPRAWGGMGGEALGLVIPPEAVM